jgi:LacI family transcriptional regulator
MRDVALSAGVSISTVSNVINRENVVAPATRERVQAAIDRLGFVRNESARQLRSGQSRSVGLVVPDVSNPYFTDVARGVEERLADLGITLLLIGSDDDPAKEARHLRFLAEQRVQGVLIHPARGEFGNLRWLAERQVPFVMLNRKAGARQACSVSVDDVGGGRMAMAHLLERGHRRLAFVGGVDVPALVERHKGALLALEAFGRPDAMLTRLADQAPTVEGGQEAGRLLAGMPRRARPSGVVCANDLLSLGLMRELRAGGVDVGREIAVVGYDDVVFAAVSFLPLSSVRQPRHEVGVAAAELLLEEARKGAHRHRQIVFQPSLVVRASSECPYGRGGASAARM